MDFFDLKGLVSALLDGLQVKNVRYSAAESPTFHPGKTAHVLIGDTFLGVMGELHPLVRENYILPGTPLLAAELDLELLLSVIPLRYDVLPVPAFPPMLEDLAVVVDESLPAERVAEMIRQAGGQTVIDVRLFDVYRGDQIGAGLKSLAYSLTYQAQDRTLTDPEAAQIRQRIIRRLEQELGAKLRS
jgi:phenylalanyl-tRNA synthetase beta chain